MSVTESSVSLLCKDDIHAKLLMAIAGSCEGDHEQTQNQDAKYFTAVKSQNHLKPSAHFPKPTVIACGSALEEESDATKTIIYIDCISSYSVERPWKVQAKLSSYLVIYVTEQPICRHTFFVKHRAE